MKINLFVLIIIITTLHTNFVKAQQVFPTYTTQAGDTQEVVQLNEAVVVAKIKWANDTLRYNYNQMKSYMKIVLPYALQAVALFNEIDSVSANMKSSERKAYAKSRETEMRAKFSDKIKNLNTTQGKYLVKMINRQAKSTCYNMIGKVHSSAKAISYQIWAKLNGINLNEDYKPENNRDFERIMKSFGY